VRSATFAYWASTSFCAMDPANSKSLLVIRPLGFFQQDNWSRTHCGNRSRHKRGTTSSSPASMDAGIKWTPPIPLPAASHAPSVRGTRSGINSAIRVGRDVNSCASSRKSSRKPCSVFVNRSRSRPCSSCRNASWRIENKPVHPGRATDIERSSPITLCQSFVAIQR